MNEENASGVFCLPCVSGEGRRSKELKEDGCFASGSAAAVRAVICNCPPGFKADSAMPPCHNAAQGMWLGWWLL